LVSVVVIVVESMRVWLAVLAGRRVGATSEIPFHARKAVAEAD
jgi:hypothetical protein